MIYVKYFLLVIKYILLVFLVSLSLLFISVFIQIKVSPNKIPSIFGYKPFIVLSGSMETELYKRDLAIVKTVDKNTLIKQDTIAFRDNKNYVVTHRIVDIIQKKGKKEFITKGDNNNGNDSGTVSLDNIEGKYIFKTSGLGNVLLELKKPLTLFVILGIIAVFGIIWIILGNNRLSSSERKELESLRKEKQQKK